MALALYDRVQETTTTAGTGTITLDGAVPGFQSFAVIGNGNTCYYTIVDNGAWEVGIGTYSSTGPTLARTTILSNSNGNTTPINLSGNVSIVFVTYPAEKSVNLDAAGNVSPLGTVSSGTWQGSTVGVAYGGTGVTSSSGANSVVLRDSNENIEVNRVAQKRALTTAAGGTTALTVGSAFLQTLIGTGGQTFTLPDATLLPVGTWFLFDNDATGTLTIQDYATGAIDIVPPGGYVLVILEDNSTVAGIWIRTGLIPAEAHWGTNSLDLGGSTVITNGSWQGTPVGVVYGGTGLNSISAANYALYSTGVNTLTAGTLPIAAGGTGATSLAGANIATTNTTNTFTAPQIISVNDASDALRITQVGSGNALLVEDSANPDTTPTVIDANGRVIVGRTSAISISGAGTPAIQLQANVGSSISAGIGATNWEASIQSASLVLSKSRSGTIGTNTILNSGDRLGDIWFYGDDGSNFINGALIRAEVDGAPGTGSMPGRLTFLTTPSGSSTLVERMRIDSVGRVNIGGSGFAGAMFSNQANITGSTSAYGFTNWGTILSPVTVQANYFHTAAATAAATFTLASLRHYYATQGTFGLNSVVSNQFGFHAESSLTGATNNFGFYSNIASGTGRWNFYANGTAQNYFAGRVGIGVAVPEVDLDIRSTDSAQVMTRATTNGIDMRMQAVGLTGNAGITGTYSNHPYAFYTNGGERMRIDTAGRVAINGATTAFALFAVKGTYPSSSAFSYAISADGTIPAATTTGYVGYDSVVRTTAASFVLTSAAHFQAFQAALGAGSSITSQVGFNVTSTLIGATNNYGFYSDIAAATGRWNFYAAGSAQNYFAGNTGIGTTNLTSRLDVSQSAQAGVATFVNTAASWAADVAVSYRPSGVEVSAIGLSGRGDGTTWISSTYGSLIFRVGATPGSTVERARIAATGEFLVGTTTNTNSSRIVAAGTISETVGSTQYLVASQYDVGSAPNQIPLNQYLGSMAFQDSNAISVGVAVFSGNVTLTAGALRERQTAVAASNIDLSTGNFFTRTISGTTTFTVSNVPASGTAMSFILDLTNGGSATVNWWTGVRWAGGVAPTLTAAGRDSLGFYTYDGGTTWTGLLLGKDIK